MSNFAVKGNKEIFFLSFFLSFPLPNPGQEYRARPRRKIYDKILTRHPRKSGTEVMAKNQKSKQNSKKERGVLHALSYNM